MRSTTYIRRNTIGARCGIILLTLACPALCQMVYNVSVYNDASTDGNTLFATSTTVDNSTGCAAHGSYTTIATLIGPDGTQAPSTSPGMVSNTSMAINGQTGTFTVTGVMQLYCGCFLHWVGGGGPSLDIHVAWTTAYYTNGIPTIFGCDYKDLACLGTSYPSCTGFVSITLESSCSRFTKVVFLKVTVGGSVECFPIGVGQPWPGPGTCN